MKTLSLIGLNALTVLWGQVSEGHALSPTS